MKERLRQVYKSILHKHPYLGFLLKRLYKNKFIFNSVKRKIKGEGNKISYNKALLSSVLFDVKGRDNRIEIGEQCILKNVVFFVRGNGHSIKIKRDCRFNRGGNIWLEDDNCSLLIEKNSTFEDVHLALTESNSKISIGKDCMFAYDIDIRTGDSHSIISKDKNERTNYAENVLIGDHVWIAAHSILLKGTTIAEDSVVATGSVVAEKFTDKGIIIGGNPARKIKSGITWSRKRN